MPIKKVKPPLTRPSIDALLEQKSNYIIIRFGYSQEYVVPYDIGIGMLKLFEHSEILSEGVIQPIREEKTVEFKVISQQEYLGLKMSYIIGEKVNYKI